MKNKYQRMNKKEQKECKKNYYNTKAGKEMNIRLTRLFITGLIGILFAVFIILNGNKNNTLDWTDWLTACTLTVASLIFIISSFVLRGKNLNKYAIKNFKESIKND